MVAPPHLMQALSGSNKGYVEEEARRAAALRRQRARQDAAEPADREADRVMMRAGHRWRLRRRRARVDGLMPGTG